MLWNSMEATSLKGSIYQLRELVSPCMICFEAYGISRGMKMSKQVFSFFHILAFLWVFWVSDLDKVTGNAEGDALNALKTNLLDPNNVLQSWDPTLVNPCTWFNITCNGDNSVTRVDLGNANLSGQLVSQLDQLANLQYLELYGNNISGKIPEELGNLTNLVSLDLYLNGLTGSIPDTLGNLKKLRFLRLNNNSLSGTIPVSLTTITSLQVLDLSHNRLTGHIPVNGSFALFTPISFADNPLNGQRVSQHLPADVDIKGRV